MSDRPDTGAPNPLFEAYAREKLREQEIEMSAQAERWIHCLRVHYDAAIKEGFTSKQAFLILDMLWERSDEMHWRQKEFDRENQK
jgi:hypothetical protein